MEMKGDTRNRILVASLLLFNEHGEPRTTTNEIADEVDISPGNLHYHFRKKGQIVDALLEEFQADARRLLATPEDVSLDDFWMFLHLLLEVTAAYRFLFRDLEALSEAYPRAGRVLGHFAKGLTAIFELYLRGMSSVKVLQVGDAEAAAISRNLAVLALFSGRFDWLTGEDENADDEALRIAGSILSAIRPFAVRSATPQIDRLSAHYTG
jgi:AcrR family transcriptional regulator